MVYHPGHKGYAREKRGVIIIIGGKTVRLYHI